MAETSMDEGAKIPEELVPCSICGRTFLPEPLRRHERVCEKNATRKRKTFDSRKQRVEGTELASFQAKAPVKKPNSASDVEAKPKPPGAWKEKHLELVKIIREARGALSEMSLPTKRGSAVSLTTSSSNEKCPSCDRAFGPKAYDRHVEWCREHKARVHQSPASLQIAKERLEARIKYRVPPLNKSKRQTVREKYAQPQANLKSSSTSNFERSPSIVKSSKEDKQNELKRDRRSGKNFAYGDYQSDKETEGKTGAQKVNGESVEDLIKSSDKKSSDLDGGKNNTAAAKMSVTPVSTGKQNRSSVRLMTWKDTVQKNDTSDVHQPFKTPKSRKSDISEEVLLDGDAGLDLEEDKSCVSVVSLGKGTRLPVSSQHHQRPVADSKVDHLGRRKRKPRGSSQERYLKPDALKPLKSLGKNSKYVEEISSRKNSNDLQHEDRLKVVIDDDSFYINTFRTSDCSVGKKGGFPVTTVIDIGIIETNKDSKKHSGTSKNRSEESLTNRSKKSDTLGKGLQDCVAIKTVSSKDNHYDIEYEPANVEEPKVKILVTDVGSKEGTTTEKSSDIEISEEEFSDGEITKEQSLCSGEIIDDESEVHLDDGITKLHHSENGEVLDLDDEVVEKENISEDLYPESVEEDESVTQNYTNPDMKLLYEEIPARLEEARQDPVPNLNQGSVVNIYTNLKNYNTEKSNSCYDVKSEPFVKYESPQYDENSKEHNDSILLNDDQEVVEEEDQKCIVNEPLNSENLSTMFKYNSMRSSDDILAFSKNLVNLMESEYLSDGMHPSRITDFPKFDDFGPINFNHGRTVEDVEHDKKESLKDIEPPVDKEWKEYLQQDDESISLVPSSSKGILDEHDDSKNTLQVGGSVNSLQESKPAISNEIIENSVEKSHQVDDVKVYYKSKDSRQNESVISFGDTIKHHSEGEVTPLGGKREPLDSNIEQVPKHFDANTKNEIDCLIDAGKALKKSFTFPNERKDDKYKYGKLSDIVCYFRQKVVGMNYKNLCSRHRLRGGISKSSSKEKTDIINPLYRKRSSREVVNRRSLEILAKTQKLLKFTNRSMRVRSRENTSLKSASFYENASHSKCQNKEKSFKSSSVLPTKHLDAYLIKDDVIGCASEADVLEYNSRDKNANDILKVMSSQISEELQRKHALSETSQHLNKSSKDVNFFPFVRSENRNVQHQRKDGCENVKSSENSSSKRMQNMKPENGTNQQAECLNFNSSDPGIFKGKTSSTKNVDDRDNLLVAKKETERGKKNEMAFEVFTSIVNTVNSFDTEKDRWKEIDNYQKMINEKFESPRRIWEENKPLITSRFNMEVAEFAKPSDLEKALSNDRPKCIPLKKNDDSSKKEKIGTQKIQTVNYSECINVVEEGEADNISKPRSIDQKQLKKSRKEKINKFESLLFDSSNTNIAGKKRARAMTPFQSESQNIEEKFKERKNLSNAKVLRHSDAGIDLQERSGNFKRMLPEKDFTKTNAVPENESPKENIEEIRIDTRKISTKEFPSQTAAVCKNIEDSDVFKKPTNVFTEDKKNIEKVLTDSVRNSMKLTDSVHKNIEDPNACHKSANVFVEDKENTVTRRNSVKESPLQQTDANFKNVENLNMFNKPTNVFVEDKENIEQGQTDTRTNTTKEFLSQTDVVSKNAENPNMFNKPTKVFLEDKGNIEGVRIDVRRNSTKESPPQTDTIYNIVENSNMFNKPTNVFAGHKDNIEEVRTDRRSNSIKESSPNKFNKPTNVFAENKDNIEEVRTDPRRNSTKESSPNTSSKPANVFVGNKENIEEVGIDSRRKSMKESPPQSDVVYKNVESPDMFDKPTNVFAADEYERPSSVIQNDQLRSRDISKSPSRTSLERSPKPSKIPILTKKSNSPEKFEKNVLGSARSTESCNGNETSHTIIEDRFNNAQLINQACEQTLCTCYNENVLTVIEYEDEEAKESKQPIENTESLSKIGKVAIGTDDHKEIEEEERNAVFCFGRNERKLEASKRPKNTSNKIRNHAKQKNAQLEKLEISKNSYASLKKTLENEIAGGFKKADIKNELPSSDEGSTQCRNEILKMADQLTEGFIQSPGSKECFDEDQQLEILFASSSSKTQTSCEEINCSKASSSSTDLRCFVQVDTGKQANGLQEDIYYTDSYTSSTNEKNTATSISNVAALYKTNNYSEASTSSTYVRDSKTEKSLNSSVSNNRTGSPTSASSVDNKDVIKNDVGATYTGIQHFQDYYSETSTTSADTQNVVQKDISATPSNDTGGIHEPSSAYLRDVFQKNGSDTPELNSSAEQSVINTVQRNIIVIPSNDSSKTEISCASASVGNNSATQSKTHTPYEQKDYLEIPASLVVIQKHIDISVNPTELDGRYTRTNYSSTSASTDTKYTFQGNVTSAYSNDGRKTPSSVDCRNRTQESDSITSSNDTTKRNGQICYSEVSTSSTDLQWNSKVGQSNCCSCACSSDVGSKVQRIVCATCGEIVNQREIVDTHSIDTQTHCSEPSSSSIDEENDISRNINKRVTRNTSKTHKRNSSITNSNSITEVLFCEQVNRPETSTSSIEEMNKIQTNFGTLSDVVFTTDTSQNDVNTSRSNNSNECSKTSRFSKTDKRNVTATFSNDTPKSVRNYSETSTSSTDVKKLFQKDVSTVFSKDPCANLPREQTQHSEASTSAENLQILVKRSIGVNGSNCTLPCSETPTSSTDIQDSVRRNVSTTVSYCNISEINTVYVQNPSTDSSDLSQESVDTKTTKIDIGNEQIYFLETSTSPMSVKDVKDNFQQSIGTAFSNDNQVHQLETSTSPLSEMSLVQEEDVGTITPCAFVTETQNTVPVSTSLYTRNQEESSPKTVNVNLGLSCNETINPYRKVIENMEDSENSKKLVVVVPQMASIANSSSRCETEGKSASISIGPSDTSMDMVLMCDGNCYSNDSYQENLYIKEESKLNLFRKPTNNYSDLESLDGDSLDVWVNALTAARMKKSNRKCYSDVCVLKPLKFFTYKEAATNHPGEDRYLETVVKNSKEQNEKECLLSRSEIFDIAAKDFVASYSPRDSHASANHEIIPKKKRKLSGSIKKELVNMAKKFAGFCRLRGHSRRKKSKTEISRKSRADFNFTISKESLLDLNRNAFSAEEITNEDSEKKTIRFVASDSTLLSAETKTMDLESSTYFENIKSENSEGSPSTDDDKGLEVENIEVRIDVDSDSSAEVVHEVSPRVKLFLRYANGSGRKHLKEINEIYKGEQDLISVPLKRWKTLSTMERNTVKEITIQEESKVQEKEKDPFLPPIVCKSADRTISKSREDRTVPLPPISCRNSSADQVPKRTNSSKEQQGSIKGDKSCAKLGYDPFLSAKRQLEELLTGDDFPPPVSSPNRPLVNSSRPHTTNGTATAPKESLKNSRLYKSDEKLIVESGKRASVIDPPFLFQDKVNSLNEEFDFIENFIKENFPDTKKKENSKSKRDAFFLHQQRNISDDKKYSISKYGYADDLCHIDPKLINETDNLAIPSDFNFDDNSPEGDHILALDDFRNKNDVINPSGAKVESIERKSRKSPGTLPALEKPAVLNRAKSYDKTAKSSTKLPQKSLKSPVTIPKQPSYVAPVTSIKKKNNPTSPYLKRSLSLIDSGLKYKNARKKEESSINASGQAKRSPGQHYERTTIVQEVKVQHEKREEPKANVLKAGELFSVDDEIYEEYKKYEESYLRERQQQLQQSNENSDEYYPSPKEDSQLSHKTSGDSAYSSLNRKSSKVRARTTKLTPLECQRSNHPESTSSSGTDTSSTSPSHPPPPPPPIVQHKVPKFCHECGSRYPIDSAKFCIECGVKRLLL